MSALRFLTIFSTNLDEFYEIRVASIKEQVGFGLPQLSVDGRGPQDTLQEIKGVARTGAAIASEIPFRTMLSPASTSSSGRDTTQAPVATARRVTVREIASRSDSLIARPRVRAAGQLTPPSS